jgi:lipopolysaccharide transport system ATP-binding protein
MSDVAISVRGVSKAYTIAQGEEKHTTLAEKCMARLRNPLHRPRMETFHALKDVSFDVKKGDVVGIIGRNGAGKSTLLKILSRITEPTKGEIKLYGRVASLLEVGTGFHPELTGRENIFLNGAILGMTRGEIRKQFDAIVDFSEITSFLDTPVKRYSSGMYVRLAFAVAAHLNPEILIVDEVLAVGDAEFQTKCLGKMKDVASGGRTVLFVSHNMNAVQQLCARALLIRRGVVDQQGDASEVVSSYLSDASRRASLDFDLSCHPARASTIIPIIKRLRFLSRNRNVDRVVSRSPLDIEIELYPPRPLRSPRVAIAIEDSAGRRLTTMASYFQGCDLGNVTSSTVVRCHLPEVRLAPGRYLFSVSVGTTHDGLLDALNNAGWFSVVEGSTNMTELYLPVYGPILTESEWTGQAQSVEGS